MLLPALFAKGNDEWATPRAVVESSARVLGVERFALDAAATEANAQAQRFCTLEHDGLTAPWEDATWCNPPFSRVAEFAYKARREAQVRGVRTAFLTPARVDTRWWHEQVMPALVSLHLCTRRLEYIGATQGRAPFPTVLAILGPRAAGHHPTVHSLLV